MISASKRSPPIDTPPEATTSARRSSAPRRLGPRRMIVRSDVPAPKSATSTSSSVASVASYASAAAIGSMTKRMRESPPARAARNRRRSASASGSASGEKSAGRPSVTSSSAQPAAVSALSRIRRSSSATRSSSLNSRPRICVAVKLRLGSQPLTDWMKRPSERCRYSSMAAAPAKVPDAFSGKKSTERNNRASVLA